MHRTALAAAIGLLLLAPGAASAQNPIRVPVCGIASPGAGAGNPTMDANGNLCVATDGTSYQGTMSISAATSTPLASGSATMAPNTTFPARFGQLTVVNTGANAMFVCWFGGTCGTATGGQPVAANGTATVILGNTTTAPTFYSTSGTTIFFRN